MIPEQFGMVVEDTNQVFYTSHEYKRDMLRWIIGMAVSLYLWMVLF